MRKYRVGFSRELTRITMAIAGSVLFAIASISCAAGPVEGGPGKRVYAEAEWDAKANRMFIVEGQVGVSTAPADSWTWDPAKRAWSGIAGIGGDLPTCSMAWYASAGTMVCFVSTRWTSLTGGNGYNVSETWIYDPAANAWNALQTAGTPTPGLLGCRVAYSSKADRLVLFGGNKYFGGSWMNETWVLDLAAKTWSLKNPPASPPGRNYFQMAYDEGADRFIVFGSDNQSALDTKTWAYDLGADAWSTVEAALMKEPLVYADMVYVPELGGCLLFGGVTGLEEKPRGATWLFTIKDGWTKLETEHAPTPRGWHAMAWDPVSKRAWLYGGGGRRNMPTQELWYWDLKKRDWFQVERKL